MSYAHTISGHSLKMRPLKELRCSREMSPMLCRRVAKYIATVTETGRIVVWVAGRAKKVATCSSSLQRPADKSELRYTLNAATALCFNSCDERVLYFCNFEGFHVWEWKKGRAPRKLLSSAKCIPPQESGLFARSMACSSDGKQVVLIDLTDNVTLIRLGKKPTADVIQSGRRFPRPSRNHVCFVPQSQQFMISKGTHLFRLDVKRLVLQPVPGASTPHLIGETVVLPNGMQAVAATRGGTVHLFGLRKKAGKIICSGPTGPFDYRCFGGWKATCCK